MAGKLRYVVIALAVTASACGWTQYGGNAGRTGFAPFDNSLTLANVNRAGVAWTAYGAAPEVAVNGGFVYGGQGLVSVWPIASGRRCSGSPPTCLPQWYAASHGGSGSSDPVIDGTTMFTAEISTIGVWTVSAYDLRAPCTTNGAPSCQPIWTGVAGVGSLPAHPADLTVGGGRIYLNGEGIYLTAFDEQGRRNCAGVPVTCQPLFTVLGAPRTHPPALDGSRLLIPVADGIDVLDVTAAERCPTACQPAYRLVVKNPGEASASGGTAYTTAGNYLYAFDDTGPTGCSDTTFPFSCQPQWRGRLAAPSRPDAPVVTGTHVFANTINVDGTTAVGGIEAFKREHSSCDGSPVTCSRSFMTEPGSTYTRAKASANAELLIVASATAPDPFNSFPVSYRLSFYDVAGAVGCSARHRCKPVATIDLGNGASTFGLVGRPAVADGVVVVPRFLDPPVVVGLP